MNADVVMPASRWYPPPSHNSEQHHKGSRIIHHEDPSSQWPIIEPAAAPSVVLPLPHCAPHPPNKPDDDDDMYCLASVDGASGAQQCDWFKLNGPQLCPPRTGPSISTYQTCVSRKTLDQSTWPTGVWDPVYYTCPPDRPS